LENSSSIAENEINGACYQAIYEKLTVWVGIEGVLVG
jgi:hypothetical protein